MVYSEHCFGGYLIKRMTLTIKQKSKSCLN
ncbi:hypothetical protein barba126A_phanotate154 [Rheinheimera phage vB_RspM_barba_12-6A]|uniref:Uncharacterized protein n=31 Tax=Barbavirus barba18A TaxID=2734090 RepID=A0A7G9VS14_9CAUD|nr:hypothetical protein barba13A_phanotate101 [Rheinheimera phage vB_RspM_barba_1-3A]QNO01551.1 hypothetical protein barba108A_phanotate40 [Rheinheimera phage vB_RspM_barba_10-8A]QNO01678.1 hypothetical protein barba108B_phanotate7 [Rheinheimera phage vB_RspM_barba_10-8B]QNO01871.1 hypothetical protein barba108D_phanotate40 [Rheinheimera phage vB_RspM_barba_10-8D]QNO02097.1 hypothetical protein barba109A_phanotate105 [Rheinheimera phage vB_RspM_barba_10-9A]QNO02263.1 hypothetical protein barba